MTIAVLGAGISGCGTALELANRGHHVVLFDRRDQPMQEASRWSEGKIHLGLVYAKDNSFRTARMMLEGALEFERIVARWVDLGDRNRLWSDPFDYAVLRDSLLSPEQIHAHFARVESSFRQQMASSGGSYGQMSAGPLYESVEPESRGYDSEHVAACFTTQERSVDTHLLADLVCDAVIEHPRIDFIPGMDVREVLQSRESYRVVCYDGEAERRFGSFRSVVNALWANRLVIDARRGFLPDRPFYNRMKLGVNVWPGKRDLGAPTITYVLGPFGDIVRFPSGRTYLSWYPAGMFETSESLEPIDWREKLASVDQAKVIADTVAGLQRLTPALEPGLDREGVRVQVEGGTIFAWGESDIDDPGSELHRRFDVGPQRDGGYISIDTGKFTTAPMFCLQAAECIAPSSARHFPVSTSRPVSKS
jgi:glycine/D-amino acid oxidase-like deaminating enzyme